jgi:hypothetical protein
MGNDLSTPEARGTTPRAFDATSEFRKRQAGWRLAQARRGQLLGSHRDELWLRSHSTGLLRWRRHYTRATVLCSLATVLIL